MMKKQTVAPSSAPKRIAQIQFGTLVTEDIQKISEFQVCNPDLLQQPQRTPAMNGCNDTRLGISDKVSLCKTCK